MQLQIQRMIQRAIDDQEIERLSAVFRAEALENEGSTGNNLQAGEQ